MSGLTLQNIIDVETFEGMLNSKWFFDNPQFITYELYKLRDAVSKDGAQIIQNKNDFSLLCQKIIRYLQSDSCKGRAVSVMDDLIEEAIVHLNKQTAASEYVLRRPF